MWQRDRRNARRSKYLLISFSNAYPIMIVNQFRIIDRARRQNGSLRPHFLDATRVSLLH